MGKTITSRRGRAQRRYPSLAGGSAFVALAVVGLVALTACGVLVRGGNGGDGTVATDVSILAPDFEFEVYQRASLPLGERLRLSDLRGKPVVLNFFAGLCPPCRAEMPGFQAVNESFGDEVTVLGIDVGPLTGLGSRRDGQSLLVELGMTYPAGAALNASEVAAYQILGMPTTVFIDAEGAIQRKWTSFLPEQTLVTMVEELIQAS